MKRSRPEVQLVAYTKPLTPAPPPPIRELTIEFTDDTPDQVVNIDQLRQYHWQDAGVFLVQWKYRNGFGSENHYPSHRIHKVYTSERPSETNHD